MFPSSTKVLTGLAAAIVISAGVVWHRYFRRVAQSDTDLNRHPGVTSSYIVKPGLQPRPTDAPPSIGKVWLIVHHGRSPAGYTTGFLQKQGRDVEIIDFELPTSTFPPVDDRYEGIVFLGGYQGAYESDIHPFLTKEKEFMIAHHKRGTPMLGICLGCQLLADALGGKAFKIPTCPEIGIVTLALTDEGKVDPVMKHFGSYPRYDNGSVEAVEVESKLDPLKEPTFVCHHGDSFTVPPEGKLLAITAYNNGEKPEQSQVFPQVFSIGNALGVQFHPEARGSQYAKWAESDIKNPGSKYHQLYGVDKLRRILSVVQSRSDAVTTTSGDFFEIWFNSLGLPTQ